MLLVLALNTTTSSLTGQIDYSKKEWKPLNYGLWEMFYNSNNQDLNVFDIRTIYQNGKYHVISALWDNGKKPIIVDGKPQNSPFLIWDEEKDSFLSTTDNWLGDPMKTVMTFKCDSSTYYVTDRIKMYKVEIDLSSKKLTYTKVFQGFETPSPTSKYITGFHKGENYLYAYGGYFIHLFELDGTFIKSLRVYEDGESTINGITSVAEYDDTTYFGYPFAGGLPDGSGMAILDLATGKVTKQYNAEWGGAFHYEPKLSVVNGILYLSCDPSKYGHEIMLFKYAKGKWYPVLATSLPEIHKNKAYIAIGIGEIFYPTNDTIKTKSEEGYRELINGDSLGPVIGPLFKDPFKHPGVYVGFSESFQESFYQSHLYPPLVEYVFEAKGKTYGIGHGIVAELIDKPTSIFKVSFNVLRIYPNPAKDVIHISNLEKESAYTVTDMTGKTILTGNAMESIDVSSLNPGMYVLYIANTGMTSSAKFVKE